MPSEKLRWETLEALKNSKKGKISFNPHWSHRGEDILSGCDDVFSLSWSCGSTLERLASKPLPSPSKPLPSSTQPLPSSPKPLPFLEEAPLSLSSSRSTSESEPAGGEGELSLLSPQAMETEGRIRRFQEEQREKAQASLSERAELQQRVVKVLALSEAEQLKRVEELTELKRRQEFQNIRDMMDRETRESLGRQEKLKEEQRHRMKILNLRLREAEQQRLKEAELWRQRQAAGRERLRKLNSLQEEILKLNQLLDGSAPSATATTPHAGTLSHARNRGNQLCSQLSEVVRASAEGECPSVEDLAAAETCLHHMRALVRLSQEETARTQEQKKKEEELRQEAELRERAELQAKLEAEKKKEETAKEKTKTTGLRTSAHSSTLKWFRDLQDSAARCSRDFQQLSSSTDSQTRRLKLDFSKLASIPVSQISSVSGSQLREVFSKMENLLAGRKVATASSGGRQVSASQHPEGRSFIRYKMAEKFVKQGEEEVSSHHEAAFPLAVVFSGIWELHPEVGELLLAHLHLRCPYAVPHYPPQEKGTTTEEYYRVLGYRVDDCGLEGQDSFLKRMSGMIRLYAAILTLRWPYGDLKRASPHGLNHGWRWLAQMLNMEPLADVTATLLFDFLEVCGNALMKQYQAQFWKLLLLLKEEYLPRVEAVTSSGQMGSVTRLKHFLETSLQSRQISPPKGQLSSAFWRS